MSATLDDTLQEGRDRALARATRALLRHPLLRHGADADALRLVRQHATELRAWFDSEHRLAPARRQRGRAPVQTG